MKLLYLSLVGFLFSFSANAQTVNQYDKDGLKHGLWHTFDSTVCKKYIFYDDYDEYAAPPDKIDCPSPCFGIVEKKGNYNHGVKDGDQYEARYYACEDYSCDCSIDQIITGKYKWYLVYDNGVKVAQQYYVAGYTDDDYQLDHAMYDVQDSLFALKEKQDTTYQILYFSKKQFPHYDSLLSPELQNYVKKEITTLSGKVVESYTRKYHAALGKHTRYNNDSVIVEGHVELSSNDYHGIFYPPHDTVSGIILSHYSTFIPYTWGEDYLSHFLQNFIKLAHYSKHIQNNDTIYYMQYMRDTVNITVDSIIPYQFKFVDHYGRTALDTFTDNIYKYKQTPKYYYDTYYWDSSIAYEPTLEDHYEQYFEITKPFEIICRYSPFPFYDCKDTLIASVDLIVNYRKVQRGFVRKESSTMYYLDSMQWTLVDIEEDIITLPNATKQIVLNFWVKHYDNRGKLKKEITIIEKKRHYYRLTRDAEGKTLDKKEVFFKVAAPFILYQPTPKQRLMLKRVDETE